MKRIFNFLFKKFLAFKRRFYLLIYGDFNPYPKNIENFSYNPSEFINHATENIKLQLDIKNINNNDLNKWKIIAENKFKELLKIKDNLYLKVKSERNIPINGNYSRKRIILEFSNFRHAPIDIITKKDNSDFKGIILCLQGTNSGAHLNLGEVRMPDDVSKVQSGSALALQAVDEGYLAVSFERIGFGERREQKLKTRNDSPTLDISFHSINLGNTILGETIKEIILINKWLKNKYKKKLWLTGYSAAGTTIIAAAAIDKNVDGIAVGGCVGQSSRTIMKRGSSGFNDIPNMLEWFEFDAQIGLISPRPCIIIAGTKDHIWPYKEALITVNNSMKVYTNENSKDNLKLIKADGGHTYYPDLMWPAISKFF